MCTVLLPLGVNLIAVNKYIISYQTGMEEGPENGKESWRPAHANGMNEYMPLDMKYL